MPYDLSYDLLRVIKQRSAEGVVRTKDLQISVSGNKREIMHVLTSLREQKFVSCDGDGAPYSNWQLTSMGEDRLIQTNVSN